MRSFWAKKCPENRQKWSHHMTSWAFNTRISASHDVLTSSEICAVRSCRGLFFSHYVTDVGWQIVSETGWRGFWRVRFWALSSVSCLALAEFRGENSVSSSQSIIGVPKWRYWVHRVCHRAQWVLSSETAPSKQYSALFLLPGTNILPT